MLKEFCILHFCMNQEQDEHDIGQVSVNCVNLHQINFPQSYFSQFFIVEFLNSCICLSCTGKGVVLFIPPLFLQESTASPVSQIYVPGKCSCGEGIFPIGLFFDQIVWVARRLQNHGKIMIKPVWCRG